MNQSATSERRMRLVHCSDLHFGTDLPDLARLLVADIDTLAPDLVIVSGDFTQTAIGAEFRESRNFLQALKRPTLSIPGNHDVPRYNLLQRFTNPYKQYRRYISPELEPVYRKDNICVAGLNTARRIVPHWNWAHGAISHWQLDRLARTFAEDPATTCRVLVMHHPVWAVTQAKLETIVFGSGHALTAIKKMRVNLVLSGHVHHAAYQTVPFDDTGKTVFLSASTALSYRVRGQKNGFNVIDIFDDRMAIEIRGFGDGRFDRLETYEHRLG